MDRIAYIGVDGNLYTVRRDATDRRQLTESDPALVSSAPVWSRRSPRSYAWPTWSPDGSKLAVSQLSAEEEAPITINVVDIATAQSRRLYANDPDSVQFIGPGIPHYLFWSPDSRRLAFLAPTAAGVSLFLSSLGRDEPSQLATGAPFYMAWHPDSHSLLLHIGSALSLVDVDSLAGASGLGPSPDTFRAPGWSPDGSQMAYIESSGSGGAALLIADKNGDGSRSLTESGLNAALLWSPRGGRIALADSPSQTRSYYSRLRLLDVVGGRDRLLVEEPLLAFFWAPDGEKIAYVAVDTVNLRLTWKVVSLRGGQVRELADFLPSEDLLAMLIFFDQYALSSSIWSPDSTALVFSGRIDAASDESNEEAQDSIFVLDVESAAPPQAIAPGTLAFWSYN
ncbi:MAG: PD40 domain-containing protein [Chloroflexi bacterium]|nr:PD40 domain-containing protein [Chloroflexota bacterium]